MIEDIDLGYDDIIKSMPKKEEVEIGYYEEGEDFGLASLATAHEFGGGKSPERPFMRRSFDSGVNDLVKLESKLIGKMIDGRIDIKMVMEVIGDEHKNQIMNGVKSRTLGLEANAQVTIDRKGSDTPLVDTGRLINGIQVKVQ